jgi:hypothetical protein
VLYRCLLLKRSARRDCHVLSQPVIEAHPNELARPTGVVHERNLSQTFRRNRLRGGRGRKQARKTGGPKIDKMLAKSCLNFINFQENFNSAKF